MSYWTHVESAAGFIGSFHWLVIGYLLASGVLLAIVPGARRRVGGALLLFFLSLAGLFVAAAISMWGRGEGSGAYRWVRILSLLLVGVAIINVAGVYVFRVLLRPIHLEPPPILRDLILAGAYLILTATILSNAGVNLTGIVATSAVVTAAIGFSLQDTLGNIMGGMALQMERSITVRDWIRVDQKEGMVKEIRWRQTSIETRDWDTVIIPNSQLMKAQVTVLGRRTGEPRHHRQWVRSEEHTSELQ